MTLRKLTLSVSLLAASLIVASQAKAETWACSYIESGEAGTDVLVREGKVFKLKGSGMSFSIIEETDRLLSLYHQDPTGASPSWPSVIVIWKIFSRYSRTLFTSFGVGNPERSGGCMKY